MTEAEVNPIAEDAPVPGNEPAQAGEPTAGPPDAEAVGPVEPSPATEDSTAAEEESAEKDLSPECLALCKSAIEAMLFSSPEPVPARKLADPLRDTGIGVRGVRKLIKQLAEEYAATGRAFSIEEIAGGFQIMTKPEFAEYVAELHSSGGGGRLSQAALETLAVVAYKQPVTRADIEAIRGVQAGPLLRMLLQKGLVKITGRAEVLGRPLLYGTTKRFLEYFGLKSLNELPRVEELPSP